MKNLVFIALALSLAANMNKVMAHPDAAVKTAAQQAETQAIVHVLKNQFDKPQSPLTVTSVAVEMDWAVAGWLQDVRGGRALLNKRKGQWVVVVCGGDGLRQPGALTQTGMKPDEAQALAMKLRSAESRLSADTLRKLASFDGMLRVDADSHGAHSTLPKR